MIPVVEDLVAIGKDIETVTCELNGKRKVLYHNYS